MTTWHSQKLFIMCRDAPAECTTDFHGMQKSTDNPRSTASSSKQFEFKYLPAGERGLFDGAISWRGRGRKMCIRSKSKMMDSCFLGRSRVSDLITIDKAPQYTKHCSHSSSSHARRDDNLSSFAYVAIKGCGMEKQYETAINYLLLDLINSINGREISMRVASHVWSGGGGMFAWRTINVAMMDWID